MIPEKHSDTKAIADYFFSEIEKICKAKGLALAPAISDLLGISRSNAYKKIKGDVLLSANELLLLSNHFKLSMDAFLGRQRAMVLFRMPSLDEKEGSAFGFFKEVSRLVAALGGVEAGLKVRYGTNEVPLFYFLLFPELTAFKLYVWNTTVWHTTEETVIQSIEELLADEQFNIAREELLKDFLSLPSEEYYPVNMLDNTLNQIAYMFDTGVIRDAMTKTLFKQLNELIDWMGTWAERGKKFKSIKNTVYEANFELFHNEIMFTNNLFFGESELGKGVYCTLDNPNYIATTDERVVRHIQAWFERMRQKSIPISGAGERQRKAYFAALTRRVERMQQQLNV